MSLITKTISIKGMHCASCAMNIDFDLEDLKGVTSAKTSYAAQVCEVEFDSDKVSDQVIIETIKKTGYTVVDV